MLLKSDRIIYSLYLTVTLVLFIYSVIGLVKIYNAAYLIATSLSHYRSKLLNINLISDCAIAHAAIFTVVHGRISHYEMKRLISRAPSS